MGYDGNWPEMFDRKSVQAAYMSFQQTFSDLIAGADGSTQFHTDEWIRPAGGGGRSMILQGDGPIEKAAVLFSAVFGETPPGLSERLAAPSAEFSASGVSLIVHPRNPFAPTFHANLRYFETDSGAAWFAGGADLTPYYLDVDDARHFHAALAAACDRHVIADYPRWKAECDDYFRLPHRGEARGVGGIFFDHLTDDLDQVWEFQLDLFTALPDAYVPILERRKDAPYGERERSWQLYRRGRYVEFNLVWDRGTKFGLETDGRTESILASLPPIARWEYDHHPEPGTPEAELLELVSESPRDWLVPDSLLDSRAATLDADHD